MGKKNLLMTLLLGVVTLIGVGVLVFNIVAQGQARQAEELAALQQEELIAAKSDEVRQLITNALRDCGTPPGFDSSPSELVIDGEGTKDYFGGASIGDTRCVLEALQMPDSTWARMEITRAIDGQLSDSWAGSENAWTIDANWSYHPDDGLQIVIKLESEYLK